MTKEKDAAQGVPNVETKDLASDAQVREDQDRRAIIFASLFLLLLVGPVFLPVEGDRSLWRMTRHDSTGRVLIGAILGLPIFLGIMGIVRGLRRSVPGKTLIGIATVLTAIQTLAGLALVVMLLLFERRATESPFIWLGTVSVLVAVGVIVRSFFRTGWQRWQHLMAPMGLLALMIVLTLAGVERNSIDRVSLGGWVFLFATAALVPFVGMTLVSRRN
jgi:hypothetical protein